MHGRKECMSLKIIDGMIRKIIIFIYIHLKGIIVELNYGICSFFCICSYIYTHIYLIEKYYCFSITFYI